MNRPLREQHCRPLSKTDPVLDRAAAESLLLSIHSDWRIDWEGPVIHREFKFRNFYQTIAFVNALAWIANEEDHHPDLTVSYNRCGVQYNTHIIGGLSENDFICAARIDALIADAV